MYLNIDFAQGQVLGLPEARTNAQGPPGKLILFSFVSETATILLI